MHLKMSSAAKKLPIITDELSLEANRVDPEQTVCFRASDFFQDRWAELTHGAKNGGPFSEMMGPSISN